MNCLVQALRKVGDKVEAACPETGKSARELVTALWVHQDQLVTLKTSDGDFRTTVDHRFWNASDQEWQAAQDIDPGKFIFTDTGNLIAFDGRDWPTRTSGIARNRTIARLHSYFVVVGAEEVLVHNRRRIRDYTWNWSNRLTSVDIDADLNDVPK